MQCSLQRPRTLAETGAPTWPIFHSSAEGMVAGHTKPPSDGPSGISATGVLPAASSPHILIALPWSWNDEWCVTKLGVASLLQLPSYKRTGRYLANETC